MEEEEYFSYENDEEADMYFNGIPLQMSGKTLYRVYEHCLKPTFSSTTWEIFVILLWCFIFRMSTCLPRALDKLQHTICFALGIICFSLLFSFSFYYIILFVLVSYMTLFIASYFRFVNNRGNLLIVTCLSFLIVCEGWIVNSHQWHRIRGPQMIIAMKAISLAFDLDFGRVRQIPNLICYTGYMLCPGTCVFGPWTTYDDYLAIYKRPVANFTCFRKIITSLALAYLFLSISMCWSGYLISDASGLWLIMHRDALSFRSSHYFISYVSEVTSVFTGFDVTGFNRGGVYVTHPLEIEFPRSIISVVTNWNIPMHHWLKVYVFTTSRRFGNFFAILFTYALVKLLMLTTDVPRVRGLQLRFLGIPKNKRNRLLPTRILLIQAATKRKIAQMLGTCLMVSSLLHGLNFQIAAVLMSIGLYSYGEFVLRKKLATVFSACIAAKRCKSGCQHRYTRTNPAVVAVNVFFSCMTLLQLAYLGNVFDSGFQEEIGYSLHHTVEKWSNLHYVGHLITLLFYVCYLVVRRRSLY